MQETPVYLDVVGEYCQQHPLQRSGRKTTENTSDSKRSRINTTIKFVCVLSNLLFVTLTVICQRNSLEQ